jgi:light-regulated signal transduction histidine kinase (bacteriophytochrome)
LLIGLAVVLLVTLVVYRQIVRPIRRLSLGVRAAATRPDPTVMRVGGPAEVAHLAGEINGLLAAVDRDVTERHRTANQELEAFSYSVSHDLRAPLRAINWFASILGEDHASELSPDGRKQLSRIMTSTTRMSDLIDDLLEFARLGRASVHKEAIELGPLVNEALEFVGPDEEGRKIDFTVDELPSCHADPRLLRIVFVNLISNAVKYTRGRALARIEIGSLDLEGRTTYFVRDNGVGFDMKYAGKLFSVFERLHSADDYEGTGIGLATVRRVIERHGGRIWAEAEPDRGATFFFTVEAATRQGTRWRELGITEEPALVG